MRGELLGFKPIVLFYILESSLKIVRKKYAFHLIFEIEDSIVFYSAILY